MLFVLCAPILYAQNSCKFAGLAEQYKSNPADSLKHKAAMFLVDNMPGHFSPEGKSIEKYEEKLLLMPPHSGMRELMLVWNSVAKEGEVRNVQDSLVVDSGFLKENIDMAFEAWKAAPWSAEVDFRQFCNFILPYRVKDEHLCRGWRKALRERYLPVIAGVKDMREAFAMIVDTIRNSITESNPYCPYTLDVLTTDHIKKAECDQRCILLVAVLRALGIPAVIDVVPMWANYSRSGHSWVAMVEKDGATYTVFEDEGVAKQFNKIDASRFVHRYKVTEADNCPFVVMTEKRAAKIYRMGFARVRTPQPQDPALLKDPFAVDVSTAYGLNSSLTVNASGPEPVYLCVFRSGGDWVPVAKALPAGGQVTFSGLGDSVVYLPLRISNGVRQVLSEPILVSGGGAAKVFKTDGVSTETVRLYRKYPLCSYMTDLWGYMKGGRFEVADKADFSDAMLLDSISAMPHGVTSLAVDSKKKFRYVRYKTSPRSRMPMAELYFYAEAEGGTEYKLAGTPIAHQVDSTRIQCAFDGFLDTNASTNSFDYWIGLDFGKGNKQRVSRIVFAPSSDTNNVEVDHLYELYHFERGWKLIGRRLAKGDNVEFGNVPIGGLLLLKDKTKGREERIFEYTDGRQIWY